MYNCEYLYTTRKNSQMYLFKYRLLIDDEDDYNTVRVLNTDSYCVKMQEK